MSDFSDPSLIGFWHPDCVLRLVLGCLPLQTSVTVLFLTTSEETWDFGLLPFQRCFVVRLCLPLEALHISLELCRFGLPRETLVTSSSQPSDETVYHPRMAPRSTHKLRYHIDRSFLHMCTARDTLFTCDLEPSTRVASVSRLMNELGAPQVRIDAEPGQTLLMRNSIDWCRTGAESYHAEK